MKNLKTHIKGLFPKNTWRWLHNLRSCVDLTPQYIGTRKAEKCIRRKKEPLNVLFLVIWESIWKYDSLFQMMMKNDNFNPLIVVCPVKNVSQDYMLQTMHQSIRYFERRDYPCVCAYDEKSNTYLTPKMFDPDVIFFTRPYEELADGRYSRFNIKDVLTCYVNYLFVSNNEPWSCASNFHKSLWRYYLEYPMLQEQINEFCDPCSVKGVVTGYPLFDAFRLHNVTNSDWPIKGIRKKRIIWAPHHSISGHTGINAFSTFEKYYDFMLKIADKYKEELQIVFKPHPLLKSHLYEAEDWGKERTNAYYAKWADGENTALVDGEYVGLFLASDAMIHDCHSFTVEYLAVNKPAMFLDNGKTNNKLNDAGREARACYYKGYSEEDIESFLKNVVIGGNDNMLEKRDAFYKKYILPPNGRLAAENIIDDLLKSLGRKC